MKRHESDSIELMPSALPIITDFHLVVYI